MSQNALFIKGLKSPTAARHPLVAIALAYGTGVVFGRLAHPPLYLLILTLTLFLVFTLFLFGMGASRALGYPLLLALLALGAFRFVLSAGHFPPTHLDYIPDQALEGKLSVEGVVAEPPERFDDEGDEEGRTRLVLDEVRILRGGAVYSAIGRIRITIGHSQASYAYGDRVRATLRLRRPRGFLNPGAFDYRSYQAARGVYLEGWVGEESSLAHLEGRGGNSFLRWAFDLRQRMLRGLDRTMPPERAGLLKATILGDRSSLSSEANEAFLQSGTYHILAISGLNVSLLAGTFYFLLRVLRIPRRSRAFLSLILVNFYALLAGASPSVVRAALMTSLYLLALILDRESELWNTLALAALVLLIWNPWYLFDVGFQLTFAATAAIIAGFSLIDIEAYSRPWRWPMGSILASGAATLATFPLLAIYFNRFSLVGVVANLPIVPLSGLITATGMLLSFVLLFIPGGLWPLNWLNSQLVGLLLYLARLFGSIPWASVRLYTPTLAMIALYYLLFISLILWRRHPWAKRAALVLTPSLVALLVFHIFYPSNEGRLRMTFIDVGQGDSALLELPGGRTMLVDGGGVFDDSFDIGERVVAPYLWHRWIGKLDVLVLSHPHPDHLNGLRAILRLFNVGEVWDAAQPYFSPNYLAFQEELRRQKIPYRILEKGFEYRGFHPVSVSVLHPSRPFLAGSSRGSFSDENSNSLVLRVKYGEVALLFPGDIEVEAEEQILKRGAEIQATVIKAPHHGGKTSSSPAFLERVKPKFAVASAGSGNRFRHPDPEAIDRYEEIGARVYRTDKNGAVTVTTDGRRVWVEPYRGPTGSYP
ncbi:MAG: DNA internalization-related competence protein ComEC/Rec2 [candidate division NC10 bacterium]|nr:DNA internalization-related competence protein ComEC/Rec2 [candidate division NC10 bacterium]